MKALTFAWGEPYVTLARRLEVSCEKFGIDFDAVVRPGKPPSREAAWAVRPELLLRRLELGEPVLYLDADARVLGPLDRFPDILSGFDFAAVPYPPDRWRWGVMWCAPTGRACEVLELMDRRLKLEGPQALEPMFSEIVGAVGALVADLPPEYAWCEAWNDRGRHGNRRATIEVNA